MKNTFKGLSSNEVILSREKYGDNSLKKEKTKGFFGKFIENLSDPIIRILLIALALQIIFTLGDCNFIEIGGIIAAILISTTVSTLSECRSEKAFEKLAEGELEGIYSVHRDGKIIKIPISDIVVGDIIFLNAGEKVPCDGLILEGNMTVDQSALNGESAEAVKRASPVKSYELSEPGRAYRGSLIVSGSAVVRCERVGEKTYYGYVAKEVQTETRKSPLKLRLGKLADQISKIGYVAALLVGSAFLFNSLFVDFGFNTVEILSAIKNPSFIFSTLIRALTLMITVVVVAAPEGLPMMITVVLSANMKKMLSDKILVKKPVGIETAGSMNILFTDKTGTVTRGKPECERIITAFDSYKTEPALKGTRAIYKMLLLSSRFNTDVVRVENDFIGGNATDRAIYNYFSEEPESLTVKSKLSFTSDRKFSTVTFNGGLTLVKGAPELLLPKAKKALANDGSEIDFDYSKIYKEYIEAMNRGERVIAVLRGEGEEISSLCFIALIVMKDKLRKGAKEAIREITKAGIQIVMITGDAKETAFAIAREAGICNPGAGHLVVEAKELHKMTDEEIKKIIPDIRVVSRALPQDKTRLVKLSGELGLVVGMTGDGINDAPSLKLADVGFSMGSGTDIAKGASDIVILDNSLSAIDKTVLYGRTIFKSIRKFITFQLIMNLAASGISLIGQFIGIDTPITIIQMLWINIIMDTLGGLAFAGEAPLNYYMNEKPKRREEEILSPSMLNQIFILGIYTLSLLIFFLCFDDFKNIYSSREAFLTAFYALFIFSGIFICFSARCERLNVLSNIGKNKLFIFIMILISAIQIAMIYFGGNVFRCVPLTFKELRFAVLMAFTVIPFDLIRRIVYKLK